LPVVSWSAAAEQEAADQPHPDHPAGGACCRFDTSLQKGSFMKKKVLGLTAAAAGIGLALAMTATPASADPVGAPTFRPLAGMGSDTTEGVMQGLSDSVLVGTSKAIGSYDVTGTSPVSTKDEAAFPNCNTAGGAGGIPRANGSTAGRNALTAAMTPGDASANCLDFARSSSTTVNANQTFVPMATDGLTYAYPLNGLIGPQASVADLQLIYQCTIAGFQPLIPQAGSGTRVSWATLMGINAVTLPACVSDTLAGTVVQEHDGSRFTATNQIVPFSVAQYIAQSFGVLADKRSTAQLGQLDGINPLVQNPAQTGLRTVGNILPTVTFSNAASLGNDVFVDNGSGRSEICVDGKATIEKYGFIASTC
jgi:hypothetical protein